MKYLYVISLVCLLLEGAFSSYNSEAELSSSIIISQDSIPRLDSSIVMDEIVLIGMKSKIKRVVRERVAAVGQTNCFNNVLAIPAVRNCKVVEFSHDLEGAADSPVIKNCIVTDEPKESGTLTASEWSDLDNWSTWKALNEDLVYKQVRTIWNLPLGQRAPVFVTNDKHVPLPNIEVKLLSEQGGQLWSGVTDHKGKIELWIPAGHVDESLALSCEDEDFHDLVFDENAAQHIMVVEECEVYGHVDIMFVVDATGSMKDEIGYLMAELGDVINRASAQDDITIRTGAVLYKDKWDDYLSATTPLHEDTQLTLDFFSKYNIGGGGDYPEAVDIGIERALEQEWNEQALSRIIFLLLDAPPHNNPEVSSRLTKQISEAAARGIKLVPITASGIDRETEYLMKQMAMMTNGTYVFLTDDSGIGETHLVHTIPVYDVEQLNDLLVRLIGSYSEQVACDTDWQEAKELVIDESSLSMQLFPNPATTQVKVRTNATSGYLSVVNANGKQVLRETLKNLGSHGQYVLPLVGLVAGMYTVSIISEGQPELAQALIVVN